MNRATHRVWLIGMAITLFAVFAPAGSTARSPMITPTAIASAKLGLTADAYKHLLGKPYRFEAAKGGDFSLRGFQQPSNWTRIVFPKRKVIVYFKDGVDRAIEITTWNKAYRTSTGVGPCSALPSLFSAYGDSLKPNPGADRTYILGRSLIFGTMLGPKVTAVALYDGSRPGWSNPGGPLYVASYVVDSYDQPPCA